MSLIMDWTVPCSIESPQGTLTLNGASGQRFLLDDQGGCTVTKPLRVTKDNIPQQNGNIAHRRFTEGYQIQLKVNLLVDEEPACGSDLTEMTDALMLHLSAMLEVESGRFFFTPEGKPTRLFDAIQWLSYPTQEKSGYPAVTFTLDTPFPYSIGFTQTTPALGGTVTNNGNTDFWPVLHIDGPTDAFVVANDTIGEGIVWEGSFCDPAVSLGAGDYIEIDCFRSTVVLNGDVRFVDCGLDSLLTQFIWMQPGNNETEIVGATGYVLMNDAFG